MIFLDTNVLTEAMRPLPEPRVMAWLSAHDGATALSSIVLAELCFGVEKIRPAERSNRLAMVLAELRGAYQGRIFGFDEEAAIIYGSIMGKAVRNGRPLHAPDGMIAAIALRHQATLATRNISDFAPTGLPLANPWE